MKVYINNKLFSITSYVIISVIVVHMMVMPFLYKSITETYKYSSFEQFVSHVTEISGLLTDVLSSKDVIEDHTDIVNIINAVILGSNIQYIEVIQSNGDSISPQDGSLLYVQNFIEDHQVNGHDDDIYFLSVPVYFNNDNNKVSKLKLGFDESTVIHDYKSVKHNIIYVFAIYITVIVFLIAAITRMIHKPLYQLRDRSRDIANGNTEVPLGVTSRLSEIQYLANDLEKMRISLIRLAENMQYKATHDELTDLPNRYLFNDRLEQTISQSARESNQFAILLLDLDRFKEINDTFGHGVGDDVLSIVSMRMLQGLRDSDTVARIGGDEFSFILAGAGKKQAEEITQKIISLIEPGFKIKTHSLSITASVGISVYPEDGLEADILMRRADVAMYNAKHNNLQLASYYPDMDIDHYEKLMLANDFRQSILDGHFEALFQPKIDLVTKTPCGCELLLRWNHPKLGLIYPDKFIPIAERENLTGELTKWMMNHYLVKFFELINIDKNFTISINLSPVDLLDNSLLESISELLKSRKFPQGNLCIEVTENAIMKNTARSADILEMFNGLGVIVSIDDFGTGYSSLAYLQRFPVSELKIDKSFICELSRESMNYPIVHATITMAHDLGISVVAEGVEDASVESLLESMGCDRVQGYLYSEPLNFKDMKEWFIAYINPHKNEKS